MIWYNKAFVSDSKTKDANSDDDDEDGGGGGGGEDGPPSSSSNAGSVGGQGSSLQADGTPPIEDFLHDFEQRLHQQPIQMCIRKPVCKCKVPVDCDCDSDDYSTSLNVRGEMSNLCRYSIHLCFAGKLKIKKDFKSILRFFYFSSEIGDKKLKEEDKEIVLFDIVPLTTKREDEINSFDIIIHGGGVPPPYPPATSSSASSSASSATTIDVGGYGGGTPPGGTPPVDQKSFRCKKLISTCRSWISPSTT